MRILLILPPNLNPIKSNLPSIIDEQRGFTPPLGLLYIASYLKQETNHDIKIIDAQAEKLDYNQLYYKIKEFYPDIIGIHSLTFGLLDVIITAKLIKQINEDIKVVLGGVHPTIYPNETINLPNIDYAIQGEGEKTFTELIKNINSPKKIKGIVFKNKNKIINTGNPGFIKDLDKLPFPDRDMLNYKNYHIITSKKSIVTSMITSRGCPYKCIFCHRPQMGKIFRARSAKNIVDEMALCENKGIDEILIYDDTFTIDKKRVFEICKEIKKRKLGILWDIRSRVDTINKNLIFTMVNAGCKRIHFGIESGSQKILDILNKQITTNQIKDAFKWTKQAKIETLAYLMIGNPKETKKDIQDSINLIKSLNPDYLCTSITMPYPHTELYDLALKQKVIKKDHWKEFAKNPTKDFIPRYWEENFTPEELIKISKNIYKSFYLNPRYIIDKLLSIRSSTEFKRKLKVALALKKL